MNRFPSVQAVSYVLAHAPDLVRYGSKPSREISRDRDFLFSLQKHLRTYEQALQYLPNRVFVGAVDPDELHQHERPWWQIKTSDHLESDLGHFYCQSSLYGLLKCGDSFNLVRLEKNIAASAHASLKAHGGYSDEELRGLEESRSSAEIIELAGRDHSCPLYTGDQLVGCLQAAHDLDSSLFAPVLLENLAAKITAVMAVKELFKNNPQLDPESIDYLINSGEEAVGDRYQRGGGNLAKAIAEQSGLRNATGCDVKAFCCGPLHAIVLAGALVQAGIFRQVMVVGGGSLAKLGMKILGHLRAGMPILEDVLAGFAVLVGPGDNRNPIIRLDSIGKYAVRHHSSAEAAAEALVIRPLTAVGKTLTDVDKYAVELHNPEVTEPAGSGDVPGKNYRVLACLAVVRGYISKEEMGDFVQRRGLLGFAPTQGHVASAIPYLGHARKRILDETLANSFFIAKGSLFLGRMTQLSDGVSFLLEAPK